MRGFNRYGYKRSVHLKSNYNETRRKTLLRGKKVQTIKACPPMMKNMTMKILMIQKTVKSIKIMLSKINVFKSQINHLKQKVIHQKLHEKLKRASMIIVCVCL